MGVGRRREERHVECAAVREGVSELSFRGHTSGNAFAWSALCLVRVGSAQRSAAVRGHDLARSLASRAVTAQPVIVR